MKLLLPALLAIVPTAPNLTAGGPEIVDPVATTRAHYLAAIEELEAADLTRLGGAQRRERARLIAELRRYAERGEFGRNESFPDARVPHFVDAGDRPCAVANLMNLSGLGDLVEEVRSADNLAFVSQLGGDPRFAGWLDASGLSLYEAARIQAPVLSQRVPPTTPGTGGTWRGPGDTVGPPPAGGPSGPASTSASSGRPTTESGAARGPATGLGTGSPAAPSARPTTVSLTTTDDDGWWLWWEYNKIEFLRPNRLDYRFVPQSASDDPAQALRRAAEKVRGEALPLLEREIASPDSLVRGAAAIALGRTGGALTVPALEALLADANLDVRHRAILALGATGSAAGAGKLLALAREGRVETGERVSPFARAYAIVALGLLRSQGFEPSLDAEIERLARAARGAGRENVLVASMVYATLAPPGPLHGLAAELAVDDRESPSVRCRAIEALRSASGRESLALLQRQLGAARMDVRRSAALALGTYADELALPALQTAFELEPEPLTRGFLLTSIGRRGTPEGRRFLVKVLERGESGMRRWAAIGLGLAARSSGDGSVAAAIRAARGREKNRDVLGAYWIALGLAGDAGSLPDLARAAREASDPRERMYASTALGLLRSEQARAALLDGIEREKQAVVRAVAAQALAAYGQPADALVLERVIASIPDPELQVHVAIALAFHGTPEALSLLTTIAAKEPASSVRRAAVVDAIGMLLARATPLRLGEVSRQANYTVFSEWVDDVFQTTL